MESVVSVAQAANEYDHINERHLRRLIHERRIRFFRVGRRIWLARSDVEALLVEVLPGDAARTVR